MLLQAFAWEDNDERLVENTMKSKSYIVEYLQDDKWCLLDVMSVNTLRWNEWKREPGIGAFAHMRTEKESLRLSSLPRLT